MAENYKAESNKKKDVVERARKRFNICSDVEKTYLEEAKDDIDFIAGKQWPLEIRQERDIDKRPCLTINRLPQFKRQITNEIRQNRPAIKVSPVDDQADVETAKIFQGLIRHIEYDSGAETAYDIASEHAVESGRGFFRVCAEYEDELSFNQVLKIKMIKDRFAVAFDPHFQEPDGSDAEYAFVFEEMSHDEYKRQWPKSDLANAKDWGAFKDSDFSRWITEDTVRVADYYEKVYEPIEIVLLENRQIIKIEKSGDERLIPEGMAVVARRKSYMCKVKHYKINGVEVLDETEWLSKWIPIIPVIGDDLFVDGKRTFEGIIRHAKDPQRMYNYWASAETEAIALAPRAPFIGAEGQFEGYENDWANANRRNYAFLQYKPTTIKGQLAPAPSRSFAEVSTQAITQARLQAADDMKATTGIYDAALGNRSNENSGIAIQRRASQAQTSNFHFVDNLNKSIRHLGRILIDAIPKYYDTERAVRILGDDDQQELIWLNKIFESEKDGQARLINLGIGTYDVTVDTGPSFASRRQEAVEAMLELTKAMPQQGQLISDLLVKNMDWPGAQEIAERLRKMLPPQLQNEEKPGDIPPQVQAQMQQMQGMIKQLSDELHATHDILDNKKVEYEYKERIERMKLDHDALMKNLEARIELEKTYAQINADQAKTQLKHDIDILSQREIIASSEDFQKERDEFRGLNEPSDGGQPAMSEESNPTGGLSPGEPME